MTVYITFATIGTDAGPFNLYSDVDGFASAFELGVTRAQLLAGFPSSNCPDGTTTIRVKSFGGCINYYDITGLPPTTTTTSSTTAAPPPPTSTTTTSSTTGAPTTTTTTTMDPLFNASINDGDFFVSYIEACIAPFDFTAYFNGTAYFYDAGFTNPIVSDEFYWKFGNLNLNTTAGGIVTNSNPCS